MSPSLVSAGLPRLKWHQLRRRRSDPPFQRRNLEEALRAGAACEVDLVFTADGHAFCLHDLLLDRETTGIGPASQATRTEVEGLCQRAEDGRVLDDAPLFLDGIVETVRRIGVSEPGLVQLDIKAPLEALDAVGLDRFRQVLGDAAPAFVAGGTDWAMIERLREAAPGLPAGFDPLDHYPRSCALSAGEFRALGEWTLATAPDAMIFYLEAKLVLAGLRAGVNLVEIVTRNGALVDAWTLDADEPDLRADLRRLVEAGCHQITSNDPDDLQPIVQDIVREIVPCS